MSEHRLNARTPEEQTAYEERLQKQIRALDNVFPGIYKFYYQQQMGGNRE